MKSPITHKKQTASFRIVVLMLTIAPLWLMLAAANTSQDAQSSNNVSNASAAPSPADWTQFQRDNMQRWNPYETVLGVSNVGSLQLKWKNPPIGAAGLAFESSPAVVNGVIYFGDGGSVYALNASTGAQLWSYFAEGVQSSPAVVNGVIYFGSDNGAVYALNANTGALRWSYMTDGPVQSSPAVVNGVVYIGTRVVEEGADLSITQSTSLNSAIAGTVQTYTINVHNSGPTVATNVVVTDTLPTGTTYISAPCSGIEVLTCNLGTLANGASKSFVAQVKIPANYLSSRGETAAQITNRVTVTSGVSDPSPTNNTSSLKSNVTAAAYLKLTMTGFPNSVHQGDIVTYTMNFMNSGPSDAMQGYILDYLPTGFTFVSSSILPCGGGIGTVLCNLGPIVPNGFTLSFPVQVKVSPNFLEPGTASNNVDNTAMIRSDTVDPDPGNDPVLVSTTVIR
jgi:uncharacterized repeat protein (TIGR01451 family)